MLKEDKYIVAGCKRLEARSQKLLLEKYAGYLLSVIKRYCPYKDLAQDILQESWIQVFKNIENYTEEGRLKGWLTRIAIRQSFKELRKNNKVDYVDQTPDVANNVPDIIDQLRYQDLITIVNRLEHPRRDVFKMFVIDGMSHADIAAIMNIKESTSRVHLVNARKVLRKMIDITSLIPER